MKAIPLEEQTDLAESLAQAGNLEQAIRVLFNIVVKTFVFADIARQKIAKFNIAAKFVTMPRHIHILLVLNTYLHIGHRRTVRCEDGGADVCEAHI